MAEMVIPQDIKEKIEEIERKKAIEEAANQREEQERKKIEDEEKYPEVGEIEDSELSAFWDCMLRKDHYVEEFELKGLKFSVSTRSSEDVKVNVDMLDTVPYAKAASISFYQMEILLASALVRYGEEELGTKTIEERIEFIRKLPAPITIILTRKMNYFDSKVFKMTDMILAGNF